jgi:hypothetical protein
MEDFLKLQAFSRVVSLKVKAAAGGSRSEERHPKDATCFVTNI